MKAAGAILACVTMVGALGAAPARAAQADALLPSGSANSILDETASANSPETRQYAEGKQAIREGHWADAVAIFGRITQAGGPYADSALYWKAYALNKAGQSDQAIRACQDLHTYFHKSTWNDDCGALQIEINSSRGKPQAPQAEQSDELKLLALASLLQKNPDEATAQIKELVQGDASERLKEGAVFILGQQVPDATYPEIVRISYLEGDVRVARATENQNINKPAWNDAIMNLPINEGDSIATGKDGRVEIEFEDASTMYLAENSVLNFIDLHTTAGVPHSELALVSGTMTTHLDSLMGGETFLIRTPTENLLMRYPEQSNLRITSYLDGMAITSLRGGALNVMGDTRETLSRGESLFFSDGHRVAAEDGEKAQDFTAFDAWVADRYAARSAAMEAMMKDAGLTKPIPGLDLMKGKGHFFPCPPYGTCWLPDAPQAKAVLTAPTAPAPTPTTAPPSAGGGTAGAPNQMPGQTMAFFPCLDGWYGGAWGNPRTTGVYDPSSSNYVLDPYSWAVCHTGDWIPHNNGYAWVATQRRHHHCPVRWVRFGHRIAVVPLNPRDTKGKPPVNGHGFIPLKGKNGLQLVPVKFEGKPPQPIKSAPKEFRNAPQPVLTRVEAPRMLAHALHENAKAGIPSSRSLAMNFNLKQGFTTSRQVQDGGRSRTVSVPVGRAGSAISSSTFGGRSSAGFGALSARAGGGFNGSRGGGSYSSGTVSSGGNFSGGSSGGFSGGGSGGAVSAPAASGGPVSSPSSNPR